MKISNERLCFADEEQLIGNLPPKIEGRDALMYGALLWRQANDYFDEAREMEEYTRSRQPQADVREMTANRLIGIADDIADYLGARVVSAAIGLQWEFVLATQEAVASAEEFLKSPEA